MSRLGLSVIEHANADLYGEGQWTGTPETADGSKAPLPDDELRRALDSIDRQAKGAWLAWGATCALAGFALGAFL